MIVHCIPVCKTQPRSVNYLQALYYTITYLLVSSYMQVPTDRLE